MLASLLGSLNKERVLVFIAARGRGYARQIARHFDAPVFPVQRALDGLEIAGVLIGRDVGRTREYEMNPRYPARREVGRLIEKALSLYPTAIRESLVNIRTRPRRRGKPL